ncbi:MAG TPA: VOC family protein [Candidatus Binataceae bacterium]|jgi:catechol 2,3-dioxygenase|nr:VOC family protein [Candidatus Binataceae bacterium]
MVKPQRLGHLVINVRNLERTKKFYRDVLGLDQTLELKQPPMALFTSGSHDHHEIGCLEIGMDAEGPRPNQIGVQHIAFRMESEQKLIEAYQRLKADNVPIECTVDHGLTHSIYMTDPDGYTIEIYVDQPGMNVESLKDPKLVSGMEKLDFAQDSPSLVEAMRKHGVDLSEVST